MFSTQVYTRGTPSRPLMTISKPGKYPTMLSVSEKLKEDASEHVQQQHKAKVFRMCAFQGEQLKMDLKSEFNLDLAQLKWILTLWWKD